MPRVAVFVVGVCLSASAVARADTPTDQPQAPADVEKEADFNWLVATGNRAYLARRYDDAAKAYQLALEKKPDAIISGRFGLSLMKLGQLDQAADLLHDAVEHGQGASAQERREVGEAYDKAKTLTTWVTVNISHAGVNVTCDGVPWNRTGFSTFWRFAMPGEHTLRATLDGYEEAVQTFTAKPGDEITVTLRLLPKPEIRPSDETERIIETLLKKNRRFPPQLSGSNVVTDPNYSSKEDPYHGEPKQTKPIEKKSGPRFSISGGVVTVFGVASWNPAVGGVVGVAVRPHENVSLGLEGRAAWLTTGVADRSAISAMTAGGLLSACGHLRWFFGCGLGYVGTIDVDFANPPYIAKSFSSLQPGMGGRIGAEVRIASSVVARATVDVIGMRSGMNIGIGNVLIVEQPPVLVSAQIIGGWEF
jgi:hypothetical protein